MQQIIEFRENHKKMNNPEEIFKNIKKINIDYTQEHIIVFYLNTGLKIIDSEVLFKGGVDACLLCPKTLFRKALLKNSSKIIIAHNHPSNNLTPSNEDLNSYGMLKEAGQTIGIEVLDSIIFNKTQFYSMRGGNDI